MKNNAHIMGLMQKSNLNIIEIIRYASDVWGNKEIISQTVEGDIHTYNYKKSFEQIRRAANMLVRMGVKKGDTVGIIGWNSFRQFELYYAIGSIGAICHTINPLFGPERCVFVINHAQNKLLFFDQTFEPIVNGISKHIPSVEKTISFAVQKSEKHLCYDDEIAKESDKFEFEDLDENSATALCYTSGTTGDPKGVVYSHRSTILHALVGALPHLFGLDESEVILPVVPMFHVNSWNCPYTIPLCGSKIIFPGPRLDGPGLYNLLDKFKVTKTIGVPSVWINLLDHVEKNNLSLNHLRDVLSGGTALPEMLVRRFSKLGVNIRQGWGMTETSPVGTVNFIKEEDKKLDQNDLMKKVTKQGYRVPFVNMRIADADNKALVNDGKTVGNLQVKGPWVANAYFKHAENILTEDGWFDTGDIGNIDENFMLQITDRAKEAIKSGGEWVSTQEIENAAMMHPSVKIAAAIGVEHPKWQERPLLIIVKNDGCELGEQEIIDFLKEKISKISLPDAVEFVDALPMGATGKVLKKELKVTYKDYKLV